MIKSSSDFEKASIKKKKKKKQKRKKVVKKKKYISSQGFVHTAILVEFFSFYVILTKSVKSVSKGINNIYVRSIKHIIDYGFTEK